MRFLGFGPNMSIHRSVLPLAAVLVLGIPALSQAGVNLKSLQGGGWSRPASNQRSAFAQRPQFTQRPQFQPLNNTAFQNVFIPPKQNFQPSFRPP
ncbi:MAG TPA: hypothetical protein VKA15_14815, partial [Isosphaeraceae bacterium]|nr:hypothetical protein [Isosphaeraceae bacterium]